MRVDNCFGRPQLMIKKFLSVTSLGIACLMIAPSISNIVTSKAVDYDLIIRNGRVIDGSGRPAFTADVAIKDDRITRIGNLRGARAKREIDRSEEHTSELQSPYVISYAVFC